MKSVVKKPPYISAYPLKALEQAIAATPESLQSPYLQSLLAGKADSPSRLRISPMKANVYPVREELPLRPQTPEAEVKPEGRDWFRHYE